MRTAIYNGCLVTPYQCLNGGVLFENGKIVSTFTGLPPEADESYDAKRCYISPGFIDIHTHGGDGYEYNDGTEEAFIKAGQFHLRHGTTTLYPTVTSCPDREIYNVLKAFKTVKKENILLPDFPGIHLEGPYFSPEQCGAQDPAYLKKPQPEYYLPLLEAGKDCIARWSFAPELAGALEFADELRRRGIVSAIGHSNADYQDVVKAVEHGCSLVTHLYSGCSLLHRENAYRILGVVESAFLIDDLSVEIIADGCHLPAELLKLIVKCKGHDKICLITDSMRCAGSKEGTKSILGSKEHGQEVIIEDGVAKLPDRKNFAGSIATGDQLVRTMLKAGLSLSECIRMITSNPANVMHIADHKGRIVRGYDADFCVFDKNIKMKMVFKNGILVK